MATETTCSLFLDLFSAYDGISGFISKLGTYLQQLPGYTDFPKVTYQQLYSPPPYEPGEAFSRYRAHYKNTTLKLEIRQKYSRNRDGAHLTSTREEFRFSGYAPLQATYDDSTKLLQLSGTAEELQRFFSFYYGRYFAEDATIRTELALLGKPPSFSIYRAQVAKTVAEQTAALQDLDELLAQLPGDLKLHNTRVRLLYRQRTDRQRYIAALQAYSAAAPADSSNGHRKTIEYHQRVYLPEW